jgi:hypothetical protein
MIYGGVLGLDRLTSVLPLLSEKIGELSSETL